MSALCVLRTGDRTFPVRRAGIADVPGIVRLLAADPISAGRGDSPAHLPDYERAFAVVDADPGQLLTVVDGPDGTLVATLQLTVIPGLGRRGALRAQLEAVHVDASCRGLGLGGALVRWAVEEARRRGCGLLQLTSSTSRTDAHRFYEQLGFVASHVGFKLDLEQTAPAGR